jgi:molybdopterin synthase catalytic subunit
MDTIAIINEPIDSARVLARVQSTQAGAVILFLGTVREFTQEKQTLFLEYEAQEEMALAKMRELARQARERWPLLKVAIVHRVGRLELGDASVAVAVSSPHRADAFEAGRFLIDTLKEVVPIWKKEHWADGTTEWVHPGT